MKEGQDHRVITNGFASLERSLFVLYISLMINC